MGIDINIHSSITGVAVGGAAGFCSLMFTKI